MKKILMATGQGDIDKAAKYFRNYSIIDATIESKDELLSSIEQYIPDIVIVGDGLDGSGPLPITSVILQGKLQFPSIRFIYLSTIQIHEKERLLSLIPLISTEVYDLIYGRELSVEILQSILDIPMGIESPDVKRILEISERESKKKNTGVIKFQSEDDIYFDMDEDGSYKNVVTVSSIKPGTGKSFVSVNIATAIAEYGQLANGKKPRVALIEADLQNLSVGTVLQIEDGSKNLKTCMDKIATVITSDNKLTNDKDLILGVDNFIDSCFIPYPRVPNLKALVGSQLGYKDIEDLKGVYFEYLIDSIIDKYDVIIIDTNSSLAHTTTYSLLSKATTCFYVLNLDFNNVKNNVRYKDMLKEIKINHKVKYVLNEDVTNSLTDEIEELKYKAEYVKDEGFDLVARIPMIPKSVFLNRLYTGTPIVLDNVNYTKKAKHEILKIANIVYPIEGYVEDNINLGDNKSDKKKFKIF